MCELQARGLLLVKWSFRFWRASADRQRAYRLRQEEIADDLYRNTVTRKAWAVWLRRYRVEEWARLEKCYEGKCDYKMLSESNFSP